MKIEINENQAKILVEALELYARLGIGQVEQAHTFLKTHIKLARENNAISYFGHENDDLARYKQEMTGFAPNASYGIHSPDVDESVKTAYDMHCVLRKNLIEKQGVYGTTWNHDVTDSSKASKEDIIIIEEK